MRHVCITRWNSYLVWIRYIGVSTQRQQHNMQMKNETRENAQTSETGSLRCWPSARIKHRYILSHLPIASFVIISIFLFGFNLSLINTINCWRTARMNYLFNRKKRERQCQFDLFSFRRESLGKYLVNFLFTWNSVDRSTRGLFVANFRWLIIIINNLYLVCNEAQRNWIYLCKNQRRRYEINMHSLRLFVKWETFNNN